MLSVLYCMNYDSKALLKVLQNKIYLYLACLYKKAAKWFNHVSREKFGQCQESTETFVAKT